MSDFIASPNYKTLSICYFKASPEVIRLAVMMYVRFPLSLRNVEDLLHERGVDGQRRNKVSNYQPPISLSYARKLVMV